MGCWRVRIVCACVGGGAYCPPWCMCACAYVGLSAVKATGWWVSDGSCYRRLLRLVRNGSQQSSFPINDRPFFFSSQKVTKSWKGTQMHPPSPMAGFYRPSHSTSPPPV